MTTIRRVNSYIQNSIEGVATKEIREYYATYLLKGELVGKNSEICDVVVGAI